MREFKCKQTNKQKTNYLAMATKKLLKLKFLWNGEDPQTKLRIPGTCVFPKATSPVRRGHSENNLKKNLRI